MIKTKIHKKNSAKKNKTRTLTLRLGQIHFAGMLRGLVIIIISIVIIVLLFNRLISGLAGGKDVHIMEDAQAALKLVDEASEVGSPVDDDDSLGRLLNHHVALHCWHHQLLTIAPVNKTRTTTPLSTQHTILILVHPCFTSVSRRQNYYPTVILVFRTQLVHQSAECTSITPVYRTPFHTTLSSLLTEHTCIHLSPEDTTITPLPSLSSEYKQYTCLQNTQNYYTCLQKTFIIQLSSLSAESN